MKTTFSRTVFAFIIILLVALFLVSLSFHVVITNYLNERTLDTLKNDCSTIAELASAYYGDNAITGRDFLVHLSVAAKISQADVVLCDDSGRLVLCSDAPLGCEHQGLAISNPTFLSQVATQEFVVAEGMVEGLYSEARHVVATAIRQASSQNIIGIVLVSTPMAYSATVSQKLMDSYVFLAVLVVLAAIVVLSFYMKNASKPLRDMSKTAFAFDHGDLKARAQVPEKAPMEIQELALAFNNMAQTLEKSEYQRKEFVANVSHELKTPMTTISGFVDGILDGTIPPENHNKYLQIVSAETHRLSRLVRSMLDISRLQNQGGMPEEKKTRFDILECVGQTLISFEQKILGKRLQVDVDMPELPLYTYANQDAITQVIYNLTDNAVKFCPETGALGVKVRGGSNKIYVSVSNTGPTIPPEELPLLFDRFHKLDKSRSENRDGWGLGLYIVKTIIASHGEDISVSSADGVTEFTFTLPLVN